MKIADIEVPKIGFLDLVGCMTQSGRKMLVRKLTAPFTKIENVVVLVTEGAASAINAGTDRLSDERCAQISSGCEALETCARLVKTSVSPSGDGGKNVTDDEKAAISDAIGTGIGQLFTQDAVDAKVEELIAKVP